MDIGYNNDFNKLQSKIKSCIQKNGHKKNKLNKISNLEKIKKKSKKMNLVKFNLGDMRFKENPVAIDIDSIIFLESRNGYIVTYLENKEERGRMMYCCINKKYHSLENILSKLTTKFIEVKNVTRYKTIWLNWEYVSHIEAFDNDSKEISLKDNLGFFGVF